MHASDTQGDFEYVIICQKQNTCACTGNLAVMNYSIFICCIFFYFVVVDKRVSSLQLMHIHTFLTGIKSHVWQPVVLLLVRMSALSGRFGLDVLLLSASHVTAGSRALTAHTLPCMQTLLGHMTQGG